MLKMLDICQIRFRIRQSKKSYFIFFFNFFPKKKKKMLIDNSELLLQDISQLYNDTNNHDIKIIVGNDDDHIETFNAHSIILKIILMRYYQIIDQKRE